MPLNPIIHPSCFSLDIPYSKNVETAITVLVGQHL